MNILLVEPDFPVVSKSKNHSQFLPIGLLKLARYYINKGNAICIVRGEIEPKEIEFETKFGKKIDATPEKILITSYFTYWAKYVKKTVTFYRNHYQKAKIIVGGIYATLMPKHCLENTKCDEVFVGIHKEAEKAKPLFSYFEKTYGPLDYQIIHTSRGCVRRCKFCGVYKIEPEFECKKTIKNEIFKRKIVFYDNNLLANPNIEQILEELIELKKKKKILWCDSQSGIDGRILLLKPHLAILMKNAGFKQIRLSWDGPLSDYDTFKKQISILDEAGYKLSTDIFVFMLYNHEITFEELEQKRIKCWKMRIQIVDCRYRPLDQTYDNYNPNKWKNGQTSKDYYIHTKSGWTDKKIRTFRKHIRQQNICIRYRINFYSNTIERQYISKYYCREFLYLARHCQMEEIEPILNKVKIDYWFPENYNGNGHYFSNEDLKDYYCSKTKNHAIEKRGYTKTYKNWLKNQISKGLNSLKKASI